MSDSAIEVLQERVEELEHALRVAQQALRTDIPRTGPADDMAYDIVSRALGDV